MHIPIILLFILIKINESASARILVTVGSVSKSHHIVYQPIWKQLSLRGHHVTVLTPFPINDPTLKNLTEVQLKFDPKTILEDNPVNYIGSTSPITDISKVLALFQGIKKNQLTFPKTQSFFREEKHFDLVIGEFNFQNFFGLSWKYGCPMVGISSSPLLMHEGVGSPTHPVLQPNVATLTRVNLGFRHRVYSTFFSLWFKVYNKLIAVPRFWAIERKYDQGIPYLEELITNVSMVLSVGNYVTHVTKPNVPALIDLENIQLQKLTPLPKDIQEKLDNAKNGVVYFSLGSNSQYYGISETISKIFLQAMSELPYTFLWKRDSNEVDVVVPKNVIVKQWFPQQSVLAHPNLKVFITQGGLQSIEEAISHAVPLIGIPLLLDQYSNFQKMESLGAAKFVDFYNLDFQVLKSAIEEVAENASYRGNMRKLKTYLEDNPFTGVQKAIWWLEHVLRHNGARQFKSPAMKLHWFQYYLLDVLTFLLLLISTSALLLYKSFKLIINYTQ